MSDMPERIYAELEEQSKQLIELLDKAQWLLCDIANDGNNLDGTTFMYSALLGDDEWMIKSNEWCSEKVAAFANMEKYYADKRIAELEANNKQLVELLKDAQEVQTEFDTEWDIAVREALANMEKDDE